MRAGGPAGVDSTEVGQIASRNGSPPPLPGTASGTKPWLLRGAAALAGGSGSDRSLDALSVQSDVQVDVPHAVEPIRRECRSESHRLSAVPRNHKQLGKPASCAG